MDNSTKVFKVPFCFREGMTLVKVNEDVVCNVNKYRALRVNGKISDVDVYILTALYSLQYASKYTCIQFIQDYFHTTKKRLDTNFSKLIKLGLVDRYIFSYVVNGVTKTTPPIYTLSECGYRVARGFFRDFSNTLGVKYVFRQKTDIRDLKLPIPVLSRVVFNQFRTSLLAQYRKWVAAELYDVPVKHKNVAFNLDAVYRFVTRGKSFEFCVSVVRRNKDSVKHVLDLIEGTNQYARRKKVVISTGIPIFIVICEDEAHAGEIERARLARPTTKNTLCYYTTDVLCAGKDIFNNLITVDFNDKENSYKYIRFELSDIQNPDC